MPHRSQSLLSFLSCTRRIDSYHSFSVPFLCSYFFLLLLFLHDNTLFLSNNPPSLTETIYPSLRRNQTLTKVSALVVGKYICLFSVMGILMVEWFALVSIRNTEICSIVFLSERIYMSAFT